MNVRIYSKLFIINTTDGRKRTAIQKAFDSVPFNSGALNLMTIKSIKFEEKDTSHVFSLLYNLKILVDYYNHFNFILPF